MQLVNAKTGQPEDVGDDVLKSLAAGTHVPAGAKALINPSGELVFSPLEDVNDNLGKYGYTVPTQAQLTELSNQKEYGEGAGNVAKATLEGGLRGATFGLSDVAEGGLGISSPEAIAERRSRNPIASTVGEIGGAVGSALLAPELSPAGMVARTGEGIAARLAPEAVSEGATLAGRVLNSAGQIGAKAAGSAVEGAAYGMGQSVTEAALGDPQLNAEKVMANIGYGGFFGGALGGLLKGAELGTPAAFEKAKNVLSDSYDRLVGKVNEAGEFEAGPVIKGAAAAHEALTGNDASEIIEHAKKMKEGEIISPKEFQTYKKDFGDSWQQSYDAMEKASLEASTNIRQQEIGELTKTLDPSATAEEMQRIGRKMNIVSSVFENNPESYTPSAGKALERMKTKLDKAIESQAAVSDGQTWQVPKSSADHYLALNDLKKQLYEAGQDLKGGSFSDKQSFGLINEIYQDVQGSLKNTDVWGESAARQEAYNAAISARTGAQEQFQKEFMVNKQRGGRDNWIIDRSKVNTFFNNINDDRSAYKKKVLTNFLKANRDAIDEIDKSYQSAAFERFDKQTMSDLVDKNAAMAARAQDIVSEQPSMGYGGIMNVGQQLIRGEGPQSLMGLMARVVMDPHAFVNRLGNLERAAQKTSEAVTAASRAVFKPSQSGLSKAIGPISGELSEDVQRRQFDKQSEHLDNMNASPTKAIDAVEASTRDMYHVAPNISASMQTTALRGSQFLSSKIPRPSSPPLPFDRPFKATLPQVVKFNRYYQAVHRPLSALSELKNTGRVSPEALEAVQTVYPALYSEMKTEVMNAMTAAVARDADVPYQRRLGIAAFLGSPIDASMTAPVLQANQAVLQQQATAKNAQEKSQNAAIASTAKGLGNLTVSDRLKTSLQGSAQREA